MKQFMVILAVVFLTGCQQVDSFMDRATDHMIKKIYAQSIYYGDFSMIESENDIGYFIFDNFKYKPEENTNHIQSPYETMTLGTGDCEDYALLYMNILYVRFGIKSELVFVKADLIKTVENGGEFDHCMIRLPSGTLVEPMIGFLYHSEVEYSYTFDEIFRN